MLLSSPLLSSPLLPPSLPPCLAPVASLGRLEMNRQQGRVEGGEGHTQGGSCCRKLSTKGSVASTPQRRTLPFILYLPAALSAGTLFRLVDGRGLALDIGLDMHKHKETQKATTSASGFRVSGFGRRDPSEARRSSKAMVSAMMKPLLPIPPASQGGGRRMEQRQREHAAEAAPRQYPHPHTPTPHRISCSTHNTPRSSTTTTSSTPWTIVQRARNCHFALTGSPGEEQTSEASPRKGHASTNLYSTEAITQHPSTYTQHPSTYTRHKLSSNTHHHH
jgi:hypothetical protein